MPRKNPKRITGNVDKVDLPTITPQVHDQMLDYSSKYSIEDRITAAAYYVVLGNFEQTEMHLRGIGIQVPARTISGWSRTEWWKALIKQVKLAKNDELDAKLTNVVHNAADQINDRIINGDYKIVGGELKRIPASGRDISMMMGVSFDKRALVRGDPTSKVAKESSEETLKKLAEKFKQMTEGNLIEAVETTYEIQKEETTQ